MILAKPFAIAAGALPVGGSSYQITGTKLFLVAASEPVFIQIFRGTQLVGDFDGFNGGLEAGPYCEPFTSFKIATKSGLAGNALIGVGDDDMAYNPLAGAMTFSQPQQSALANPTSPSVSISANSSLNQENFMCYVDILAVAAQQAIIELSNQVTVNQKTAIITSLRFHNFGAAEVNFVLGFMRDNYPLAATYEGINLFNSVNAGVAEFSFAAEAVSAAGLPTVSPSALILLTTIGLPPGVDIVLDLSETPMILNVGEGSSFVGFCDTADTQVGVTINWTEK